MSETNHHFFAYLSRMKLIDPLEPNEMHAQRKRVKEHCLQVAMVAHALAVIKNKYFGGDVSPERVALFAIFHDAAVLTGDMPTPVKYYNSEIRDAYKGIEALVRAAS